MTEGAAVPRVLVVAACFYRDIADQLIRGALAELDRRGARHQTVEVPGAFEIPAAVRMAEDRTPFDGYVGLGCVIRGATSHYDYVCRESARGLSDLAVRHGLAIGYGILTTENREQAWERAAVDRGNKGRAAAEACLQMIALRNAFAKHRG